MGATTKAERAPKVDLTYVECNVTVTRPLFGIADDPGWTPAPTGVAKVSAEAMLYVYDDDEPDSEEHRVIARASAYTIDLERVSDVLEALDRIGEEVFEVAEEALSGSDIFAMLEDSDPLGGEQVSQLVIVDNVFVEEPYRGQRIGPRLMTTLVDTVTGPGFFTLVLLRAQPVPWEHLSEIELRRARKKVAAAYEGVGFEHFRKDIYWRHNAFIGVESLENAED
jgi:GNAT superfamily N-acetyltransferase